MYGSLWQGERQPVPQARVSSSIAVMGHSRRYPCLNLHARTGAPPIILEALLTAVREPPRGPRPTRSAAPGGLPTGVLLERLPWRAAQPEPLSPASTAAEHAFRGKPHSFPLSAPTVGHANTPTSGPATPDRVENLGKTPDSVKAIEIYAPDPAVYRLMAYDALAQMRI